MAKSLRSHKIKNHLLKLKYKKYEEFSKNLENVIKKNSNKFTQISKNLLSIFL